MKRFIFIQLIIFCGVLSGLFYLGYRVNITPSIPVGIYKIDNKKIEKDGFVVFNPEDKPIFESAKKQGILEEGFFEDYKPLFKRLAAKAGDFVWVNENGVYVNGNLIRNSKPIIKAGFGYAHINKILGENEYILMGDIASSFDSRYFGVISGKDITSSIRLIWKF